MIFKQTAHLQVRLLSLVLGLLLLFFGVMCTEEPTVKQPVVKIPDTTKYIDEIEFEESIAEISEDGDTLYFSSDKTETYLEEGDIITSVSNGGMIKKVVSIQRNIPSYRLGLDTDDEPITVVYTEDASITDAVDELVGEYDLFPAETVTQPRLGEDLNVNLFTIPFNVTWTDTKGVTGDIEVKYPLKKVIQYLRNEESGDEEEEEQYNVSASIQGEIYSNLKGSAYFDIGWTKVHEARIVITLDSGIKFKVAIDAGYEFSKEKKIVSCPLGTYTVLIGGTIPLVLSPVLNLYLGGKFKAGGEFTVEANPGIIFIAGVEIIDNEVNIIRKKQLYPEHRMNPKITMNGNAEAMVWVRPELEIGINKIKKILTPALRIGAKIYLRAPASFSYGLRPKSECYDENLSQEDFEENCRYDCEVDWGLYWGVSFGFGATLRVIKWNLFDEYYDGIIKFERPIIERRVPCFCYAYLNPEVGPSKLFDYVFSNLTTSQLEDKLCPLKQEEEDPPGMDDVDLGLGFGENSEHRDKVLSTLHDISSWKGGWTIANTKTNSVFTFSTNKTFTESTKGIGVINNPYSPNNGCSFEFNGRGTYEISDIDSATKFTLVLKYDKNNSISSFPSCGGSETFSCEKVKCSATFDSSYTSFSLSCEEDMDNEHNRVYEYQGAFNANN